MHREIKLYQRNLDSPFGFLASFDCVYCFLGRAPLIVHVITVPFGGWPYLASSLGRRLTQNSKESAPQTRAYTCTTMEADDGAGSHAKKRCRTAVRRKDTNTAAKTGVTLLTPRMSQRNFHPRIVGVGVGSVADVQDSMLRLRNT